MSPITATAIPDGKAIGTGLSATMASTTAEHCNTAPTLDATNMDYLLSCERVCRPESLSQPWEAALAVTMFAEYPARCLCGCEHHRVRRFG